MLWTLTHTRSDAKKWLRFLKEHGISRSHAETKMVVLTNSKDEDENNLQFLQELRHATTSTSQQL
jgi:hypothetical protein